MPRRVHSSLLLVSAALGVFAVARVALAAPQDGAALKLRKQAIYTSYLATDFASAEKALNKALALCAKPTDCEPSTRSRLHCDLGAVLVADGKKDEATAQFTAALKDDPSITIDKDVTSPDAEQVFAAAKEEAIAGGGAAGGGAAAGGAAGGGAAADGKRPVRVRKAAALRLPRRARAVARGLLPVRRGHETHSGFRSRPRTPLSPASMPRSPRARARRRSTPGTSPRVATGRQRH